MGWDLFDSFNAAHSQGFSAENRSVAGVDHLAAVIATSVPLFFTDVTHCEYYLNSVAMNSD